jgi:hypothetical protein
MCPTMVIYLEVHSAYCKQSTTYMTEKLCQTLSKKYQLRHKEDQNQSSQFRFHSKILNLAGIHLSQEETGILEFGTRFPAHLRQINMMTSMGPYHRYGNCHQLSRCELAAYFLASGIEENQITATM